MYKQQVPLHTAYKNFLDLKKHTQTENKGMKMAFHAMKIRREEVFLFFYQTTESLS